VYRSILSLLEMFFGGKAAYILIIGVILLALAVILLLAPPWRRAVRAAQERGGWRGIVLAAADALMGLVVGATIVAALGGAMLVESRLYDEHHGQTTQTNYEAIQTNWGPPHEQGELAVSHFITEEQTVLLFKDGRQVTEEELSSGRPKGDGGEKAEEAAADDGGDKTPGQAPIKIKRKVRKPVPQNSIARGEVKVDVRMNYRQKGSAFYTCYEDTWTLNYTVKNRSDKATEAEFRFPMPAQQGTYDQFTILVDGKNWLEQLVMKGNAQTWKMPMQPGQETRVQVHYASRGMEHLRYTPANMATREEYKIAMRIFPDREKGRRRFIWKDDMGLPIGSMTPQTITEATADGEPLLLEWDLKSAATTLGMGVILPKIPQPGYFGARLLHEAPLGLLLLAASLVVTWMLLGRETDLFSLAVLAVAYYLFYTLVAYLSDHLTSFDACFALAAAATLILVALYLWLGWGRNFAAHQTLAIMAVFTVYYPLAVILDDYTGLLLQVLYWVLAAYGSMLAVVKVFRVRRAAA
jgi:hypothetical protein